ncbi:ATP-binding cassette domain-containing protein [Pseudomonas aeruginosa]|uniref:ATP-binding cassette domain-containing protein n=1 Tax=Pseudomonas aeruginosa TaxID=287 RepID=UPI003D2B627D
MSTKPSTPGTPGWWDATASASRCSRACSPDTCSRPAAASGARGACATWRSSSNRPTTRPSPIWPASAHGWRRWRGSRRVALDAADYECLGERWDIRQRLADALAAEGLGHLRADTPSERLSGGECMRVALLGAFLDDADFLILDEPSNPLDGPARALLRGAPGGMGRRLLLVSHDRELLEGMQRIVELSTLGLRSYGGGYSFYAQSREEAREAAERRLDQRRLEAQAADPGHARTAAAPGAAPGQRPARRQDGEPGEDPARWVQGT